MDNFIYKLGLALILGAFIGLERQIHEKSEGKSPSKSFLGLRTFALVAPLGTLAGIVYSQNSLLFSFISAAFIILVLIYYTFNSFFTKDIGITTEISLIYTYLIGVLIAINIIPIQLIIGITVVLALILSRKEIIKRYVRGITETEIDSFISYGAIALVILPLLPNASYTLSSIPQLGSVLTSYNINIKDFSNIEIINPFKLWLVVALITGIDVFGYILERTLGQKKGWLLTSFAGGFISSTATTASLAQQSKKTKSINHLIGAAIISNFASFIQNSILILPLSFALFTNIIPVVLLMMATSAFIAFYFLRFNKSGGKDNLELTKERLRKDKLFYLTPALKFAALFLIVRLVAQVALELFGNNGFLVSVGFGAIPGMDAVLISIAELAGKNISYEFALWAFILANSVNLMVKSLYSFLNGKKEFAIKFTVSAFIIILSSVLGAYISK